MRRGTIQKQMRRTTRKRRLFSFGRPERRNFGQFLVSWHKRSYRIACWRRRLGLRKRNSQNLLQAALNLRIVPTIALRIGSAQESFQYANGSVELKSGLSRSKTAQIQERIEPATDRSLTGLVSKPFRTTVVLGNNDSTASKNPGSATKSLDATMLLFQASGRRRRAGRRYRLFVMPSHAGLSGNAKHHALELN